MNKTLESIEARWLFDMPMENIEIVVHRQSIVHSFVTFCDNSVKAQLGVPDMRLPIQWALLHPNRVLGCAPQLNIAQMGTLTFEKPDDARFPDEMSSRGVRLTGWARLLWDWRGRGDYAYAVLRAWRAVLRPRASRDGAIAPLRSPDDVIQ